jgi:nitrate/TMAO reductase-like tetraheme cytochrome c subunit
MVRGNKHVQHIPSEWVEDVRRRVQAGREFQDAVREVLAANAQLLALARQQRRKAR